MIHHEEDDTLIGEHIQQLKALGDRMDAAEEAIKVLLESRIKKEVQIETIFSVLAEVKEMPKTYTTEMRKTLTDLADSVAAKFQQLEQDMSTLQLQDLS